MSTSYRRIAGVVCLCAVAFVVGLTAGMLKKPSSGSVIPPSVNMPPTKPESSRVSLVSEVKMIGKPEGIDRKLGSIRYSDPDGTEQVVGSISWPNHIQAAVRSGKDVEVEALLEIRENASLGRYASRYLIQRWRVRFPTEGNFGPWQDPPREVDSKRELPLY